MNLWLKRENSTFLCEYLYETVTTVKPESVAQSELEKI